MLWTVPIDLAGFAIALARSARQTKDAKDLEIALLLHQIRLLLRRSPEPRVCRGGRS